MKMLKSYFIARASVRNRLFIYLFCAFTQIFRISGPKIQIRKVSRPCPGCDCQRIFATREDTKWKTVWKPAISGRKLEHTLFKYISSTFNRNNEAKWETRGVKKRAKLTVFLKCWALVWKLYKNGGTILHSKNSNKFFGMWAFCLFLNEASSLRSTIYWSIQYIYLYALYNKAGFGDLKVLEIWPKRRDCVQLDFAFLNR